MTDKGKKQFRVEDLRFGGLDLSILTAGDVIDFLDASGWEIADLDQAIEGNIRLSPKALLAGVWVTNRINMPGLTLQDIRDVPWDTLWEVIAANKDTDVGPKEEDTTASS